MLKIRNLSVTIDDTKILDRVSFEVEEHEIFMILGPNGAGKSTLVKAIAGALSHKGDVLLDGIDIGTFKPKELALRVGVLPQHHRPQYSHTVYEVVSLGRYAHQRGFFSSLSVPDKEKISHALELTGITELKDRSVLTLSGGELQRTFLAQLFAQDPRILILDEPTSHLDLQYRIAIFDIIKEWVKQKGRLALAVVHDLNTIYSYGSRALLIESGRIRAHGPVETVLSRENLKEVYRVDVAEWMQNLPKIWSKE